MVKIKNIEELKRIIESNYGYVVILESNMHPTMHKTKCEQVSEDYFEKTQKNENESKFHWFSSYSIAEKEFSDVESCKNCKP